MSNIKDNPSVIIRQKAASDAFASPYDLMDLSADSEFGVRLAVAANQKTPKEALNRLCEDENPEVRSTAVRNLNVQIENLEKLATDKNYHVRSSVASSPFL